MNKSFDDGGPAFPVPDMCDEPGLNMRDYFAAKAMQALINRNKAITGMEFSAYEQQWVPGQAYAMADAMIYARGL